jgi:hypothetical protein
LQFQLDGVLFEHHRQHLADRSISLRKLAPWSLCW